MTKRRKLSLSIFSLLFVLPTIIRATPLFEYELWMQAQTSLDPGLIEVQGRIVNTGTVALDLTNTWGALGGLPSNLSSTTCGLSCVHNQLNGIVLFPEDALDFIWLSGTQEEDLSSRAGRFLSGGLGLIPYQSDWNWTQGGFIQELLVFSEWITGPIDSTLPFNRVVINLDVAGHYIESTPFASVPEPSSMPLILTGLAICAILQLFPIARVGKSNEI